MPDSVDAIANALAEIEAAAASARRGDSRGRKDRDRKGGGPTFRPVRWLLIGVAAFLLPFWVLILGATIAAETLDLGPWSSLAVAGVATASLIAVYVWTVARKLGSSPGSWIPKLSLAIVGAYCIYGLVFISPQRLKDPEIGATYTSLHPVIRLSLSTLILVDSGAVVTDAARVPEDYAGMGLPVNERSLHFRQSDGFVYAVDLRTRGRPEWLTALTTLYMRSVGLSVLRHLGTADHLHVYLKPR
ncbi:MAG: hypothetical protein ACI9W4_001686 [Rhodothermales bacterium]|jgi:hypothetical protein